jgi:hypothetical protein
MFQVAAACVTAHLRAAHRVRQAACRWLTGALYFLRQTNGTGQDPHQAAPDARMERGVPRLQVHRLDGMQGESA